MLKITTSPKHHQIVQFDVHHCISQTQSITQQMAPHLWGLQQLDHVCGCLQIVNLMGQKDNDKIKQNLQELIRKAKVGNLF